MGIQQFRVTWPKGYEGAVDFGKVAGSTVDFEDGRLAIRFPAPFADLVLSSGEALTPAKADRVLAAARHFNAPVEKVVARG